MFTRTVQVYCDTYLVYSHKRTDSQQMWEAGGDSPFLVVGAHYDTLINKWYARCDMILQKLEILICETTAPTFNPTRLPTKLPTKVPTFNPSDLPSRTPTKSPTAMPTGVPTLTPTRSCDVLKALCFGSGAFGAECKGPSDDINFPMLLTKATTSYQEETTEVVESRIEIYPRNSIDLTIVTKIQFQARIDNIIAGAHHGAILAVGVKYDESNAQLFSLTQPIWASTSCADKLWHSWELIIYYDALEVFCDNTLVWSHARTDTQALWEFGDESPFLMIGAHYFPLHETWYSRCD